jgi:hypothetical protein
MKNFLAMMSLAIFLSACGSGDDGLPSSTTGTIGGIDVTYVGPITPVMPSLASNGTCKIPDIAMHISVPSPMRYFVNTGDNLYCTLGEAVPTYDPVQGWIAPTNLDFSQGFLKGLTCQELVSDTPDALQQIPSFAPHAVECCEYIKRIVGGEFDGYVESYGVGCSDGVAASSGLGPPISGALCSGTGEFMGWACLIS